MPATPDTSRRSAFRSLLAAAGATAAGLFGGKAHAATPETVTIPDAAQQAEAPKQAPLFSAVKVHTGGLVFVAGKGYHEDGDIKLHTAKVLDALESELKKVGSSMEKVLKVNVYLHDLQDYAAMNEVFRGRFGPNPPVRTTIACYGGVPGKSLVEMDCIAAL